VPPPTLAVIPSPAKTTPEFSTVVRPRKGRSIADKLKEFRAVQGADLCIKDVSHSDTRIGVPVLPEHLLLRDTLYLLQGISGKYVQFSRESEDKNSVIFVGDPVSCYPVRMYPVSSVQRYRILEPTKALIHRLAEVGHLYTRVHAFVREKEGKSGVGRIEQSLCHHLQTQLTEYYRLVAILESQMGVLDQTDGSLDQPGFTPTNDHAEEETGLTLKRLDVWIDDWRLRMRMMSVCVEGAKGTTARYTMEDEFTDFPQMHTVALWSALFTATPITVTPSCASSRISFWKKYAGNSFGTEPLALIGLDQVSKPFFTILQKWIFSGELYDPCDEFFVAMDPEIAHYQYIHPKAVSSQTSTDVGFPSILGYLDEGSSESDPRSRLWEAKYQFRKEMLPSFLGEAFGRKVSWLCFRPFLVRIIETPQIFSTGKSLNFIKYSCGDSDWVITRQKLSTTKGGTNPCTRRPSQRLTPSCICQTSNTAIFLG